MLNSWSQFCRVFTGTITSTLLAPVDLRKISMKLMTCRVFPKPILCARMQPNPLLFLKRSWDSTKLSYKKRIPPICKYKIKPNDSFLLSQKCFSFYVSKKTIAMLRARDITKALLLFFPSSSNIHSPYLQSLAISTSTVKLCDTTAFEDFLEINVEILLDLGNLHVPN